jgi:hypothetical protein
MDEMDITVTLTAKELAFRERARKAGLPAMVVALYAEALQRLVEEQRPVEVSPLEFVTAVLEKEHLVGKPVMWAQWPNEEKNT